MLSTLIFSTLLLRGLLVKGEPNCGETSLADVSRTFEAANIPATINLPFAPEVLYELTYPEVNAPPIHVTTGLELTPPDVAQPPRFSVCGGRRAGIGHGPFVLVIIDPDAPSAQDPSLAQVRHFVGGGYYLEQGYYDGPHPLVNKTPAVSDYISPAPPPGSGFHRYTSLLFKEPASFRNQNLVNTSSSPLSFNLSAFAEATGLGYPLGGTFFLSTNFTTT